MGTIEIVLENPLVVEEPYIRSKISKNICFYFNQDRIQYINRIIEETNKLIIKLKNEYYDEIFKIIKLIF